MAKVSYLFSPKKPVAKFAEQKYTSKKVKIQ